MSTKNILYLCPNGYLGGAEKFVLEACAGHLRYGDFRPTILFFNDGVAVRKAQDLGVPVKVLPFKLRLRNLFSFVRTIFFVRRLLNKELFSFVHATMPYSHLISYFATKYNDIKSVWFQHGPVGGHLDKLASLLPVDLILFNSEYLKELHNSSTPLKIGQNNFNIIPLGVEREVVDIDLKSDYLGASDELIVGMVGRISEWKGYSTFLEAISYLKKYKSHSYKKAKFIIVGDAQSIEEKKHLETLQNFTVQSNLTERLYFLGYRPDISNVHSSLDILIHASFGPEPFGLVVAETMIYETLVIGGDRGGIKEILIDGVTGITFSPGEPDSYTLLGEKLCDAIDSFESYEHLRLAGKRHIEENFSINKMVTSLEKSYLNII